MNGHMAAATFCLINRVDGSGHMPAILPRTLNIIIMIIICEGKDGERSS
jgi:hypothetical protein